MTEKVFNKEDWIRALRDVTDSYRVFVPVKKGDLHDFALLEEGTRPNFDFQNSRLSAKSAVYPQSERMFECLNDGDKESESCRFPFISVVPSATLLQSVPSLGFP